MTCDGLSECATLIAQAIADSASPPWLDVLNLLLTATIATMSVLIAFRVFSFDRSRALQADREQLRVSLRAWFQTLSRSAAKDVRDESGRLRSECEEIADAERANEILTLMMWAQDMLDESYLRMISHGLGDDEAHERRIIIKRRFRQFIAVWSRRPRQGRRLIEAYVSKGWAAIEQEPREAARSAQFLALKSWRDLKSVWKPPTQAR